MQKDRFKAALVSATVLISTLAASVLPLEASAGAESMTVTGTVDSSFTVAPRWKYAYFSTTADGAINGSLDWAGTANLDVFLYQRNSSGTWTRLAYTSSTTAKPEIIAYPSAQAGSYKWGIRSTTGGAADYSLSFSYPDGTPDSSYLTLLFSRSEITTAVKCVQNDSGVARLDTIVAPELQRRGLYPTGTVQTAGTMEDAYRCIHGQKSLAASWTDLAALRDIYGWTFVSHSRNDNQNIAALSAQEQWDETCGSQLDLQAHGHQDSDGLYAWPNNKFDAGVQANVIASCFAFGRKYSTSTNTRAYVTSPPYWQKTEGISGGKCNDATLACSSMTISRTYESPVDFADKVTALTPGKWLSLQAYVLVTGSRPGLWDCTALDWRAHWTNEAERYCYADYLQILDAIPNSVIVTDPKSVAQAWGRTNYTAASLP